MKNRQVWLCSRPNGIPQARDFALREAEMPRISDGEFLIRNMFLSADPAMRGWIADKSTYWPRIEVGDTMRAFWPNSDDSRLKRSISSMTSMGIKTEFSSKLSSELGSCRRTLVSMM